MSATASSTARQRGVHLATLAAVAGLGLVMVLSETRLPSIVGSLDPLGNFARFMAGQMLLWLALGAVSVA